MRPIVVAFLLAAGVAAAADVPFTQAVEIFMRAQQGQEKEVEPAVAAFDALARAEPRNPVYAAYLGSAIALRARDALIPADPKRAQAMLDHLNGYLRAALAAARKERSTLGDEFALLRGYLEILAIRMDKRLRFRLELPDSLAGVELPPMLLQPLVENAVKHGLEPKLEGGEVAVAASARNGRLLLEVRDSGLGIGAAPTSGTGAGVAQVRERLAAVYGGAASLEVSGNPSGGVTAALSLPLAR